MFTRRTKPFWGRCAAARALTAIAAIVGFSCEAIGATFFHAADTDRDWRIGLTELLRVIQFYNSDGYHVASGTEDGFAPGDGDRSGAYHSSDYVPQDWRIEMAELLRTIQLYNVRGFVYRPDTEDGYDVNPWHVPVEGDTDGDGLTDVEEAALGMDPNDADENGDGLPDGRVLAARCAEAWMGLPQCPLGDCEYPGPELLDVTECAPCACMTQGSDCFWTHPDLPVRVDVAWWMIFDLCELRDAYIASGDDLEVFYASIVSSRWMDSTAMPFLSSGSFSYYDLSCSKCTLEWVWDAAAMRRLDSVYWIALLLSNPAEKTAQEAD